MSILTELQKEPLAKKFKKITKNLIKTLEKYIKEPTEENIHDIRIAIRRLESVHRILPKKIRKKEDIQSYVDESRKLFKINTQIRDFDIISEKLKKQGSKYEELVEDLKNKREVELYSAHSLALKLMNTTAPRLRAKDLSSSKLNNRFQKIVNQLTREINQNIPIVISDEKKIEELHKLRKDFKKLRYSIELISNKIAPLKSVKSLKKIQDLLGEIHDCDIMLDYLRDIKGPNELSDVIRDEILIRREKYQQFVQLITNQKLDPEDLTLQF